MQFTDFLFFLFLRAWNIFQHARLSGWSVLGYAGGQNMSALPKCCCRHTCAQILSCLF